MKNISIMFSLLIVVIIVIFVFPFYNPSTKVSDGKIAVAVTIYPTYDIVKNIGGDKINLHQIIPFGQEPHSFEPTPKDIIQISNSQLFIYTGLAVDSWAIDLGDIAKKRKKFIKLSEVSEIIENDPHFWLDIDNLKKMANLIANRLIKLDSENENFYNENLSLYLAKLDKLDLKYKENLGNCKIDSIIVNHNAFQYLARRYDFHTFPIMGISPDDKPSAKVLAEIVDLVKERNISTLFFEELASNRVMETVAKETGVKIDSLSPFGNIPQSEIQTGYINLMYQNLEKLQKAMNCQ